MDDKIVLTVGKGVQIKRTSGDVQLAFVSKIDYETGLAAVEWFEDGQTKGKEIAFNVLVALNPDIRILPQHDSEQTGSQQPSQIPDIRTVPTRNRNAEVFVSQKRELQRDSEESSDEEIMAQSGHFTHKLEESDDDFNSNQFSPDTTTLSDPTRMTIAGPSTSAPLSSQQTSQLHPTSNGHSNHVDLENTSSRVSKRGNVVKEVEKLKKNREERRQRQAEEKAEKEAFLQKNPENPHWELLNMINEYRKNIDIKPLTVNDAVEDHLITVCVRKRPLNKKEFNRKEVDVITIPSKNQLILHEPKNKVDLTKYLENQLFRFDYTFDETCTNEIVYRYTAQPLIQTVFEGGFATCFAYGQTGAGKTHTMGGLVNSRNPNCEKGIYTLASADVFNLTKSPKYKHLKLLVSASFFEIYSGKVFDLLNSKAKLRILEDGKQQVQVVGLSEIVVNSVEEVLGLIQKGSQARTSGRTAVNPNSSRSHAVFQIYLRSKQTPQKVHGKFSLIDLAGNERGADTSSADRQTRMEGAEINKSLLALKECIRALGRKGAHLPFRVSKLTQVLRDSFVGSNTRTCMIAMVSPGLSSCEHTLNTLRYADRVKELGSGDLQSNQLSDDPEEDEESDLLQLQSLNEHDMSPEMLNFHQVISELQQSEDTMLDAIQREWEELKRVMQGLDQFQRTVDDVTFDGEAFCRAWLSLSNDGITCFQKSKELVNDHLNKLTAEEELSRNTKRNKLTKSNEYRKNIDIKPLTVNDAVEDHLITVCVRKRPLNKKEFNRKEVDVITIPSKNQLILHEPKNKVDLTKYLENQLFRFDYTFDETCTNEIVYRYTAQPLIQTVFEGGFATCFAYGQTGAGKTHTMGGLVNSRNPNCEKGIYTLASADVFNLTKSPKYKHLKLLVSASFFEIYSGKVFDLLNSKAKLRILEDGKQQVQVVGLSEIVVNSVEEVLGLIQKGSQARTSGRTAVNPNSSRSHAVFQIYLRSKQTPQKVHGKFSLIDLAGNERGADTSSADRQTRMEGAEINKSLLALKECIRALGRKGAHLPFRVSKLTQVLRDSFVGSNTRTCMIAMVSPGLSSCEHTLNTLRYADRVKELGSGDLQSNQLSDDPEEDEESDLLQLQSLNEHDMSPEMLNFHQVISELQQSEDTMLDAIQREWEELKRVMQGLDQFQRTVDDVTFDGEAFCRAWLSLSNDGITCFQKSKELVNDHLNKLTAEEELSRNTKRNILTKSK